VTATESMSEPVSRGGPLAGVRVVEMAGLGPAPFACMMLAELGADVVRVDRPDVTPGDPQRDLLNRGKRSVVLDLKSPAGAAAALHLAATADVLVEGYRPGVAERLGIGPAAVHVRNPAVVYARMTGWGQDGPLARSAGHDVNYIAITGALHAIGPTDGAPQLPLNLLGDFGGGATYLVIGVLAALRDVARTGAGQVVDAAIVDGVSHLLAAVHSMLANGNWTDQRGANLLDGAAPNYAVYQTADEQYMTVGALEPKFFAEFVDLLGIADQVTPAVREDRARWPELRTAIAQAFRRRTRDEWVTRFDGTDACVAPVLSLTEAADHHHIRARGALIVNRGVLQPAAAPRLSAHPPTRPMPAPMLDAHTREVLTQAGLPADELIASGAAGRPTGPAPEPREPARPSTQSGGRTRAHND